MIGTVRCPTLTLQLSQTFNNPHPTYAYFSFIVLHPVLFIARTKSCQFTETGMHILYHLYKDKYTAKSNFCDFRRRKKCIVKKFEM